MDDVLRDREARVAAAAQHHDVALAELRAHYEGRLAALSSEGDTRMAGEEEHTGIVPGNLHYPILSIITHLCN
jgi:hypothetical protein